MIDDARLARLPAWARREIALLQRQRDEATAKLAAIGTGGRGSDGGIVLHDDHFGGGIVFPLDEPVTFILPGDGRAHNRFIVRWSDGYLDVNHSRMISVLPRAANSIHIKPEH